MARRQKTLYVKKRFVHKRQGERMWIQVRTVRGGLVCGTLANQPVVVPLKRGAKACVRARDILDFSVE